MGSLRDQLINNYEDGRQGLWHRARTCLKQSFETSGLVLITVSEDQSSVPTGWTGSLSGLVIDVGNSADQRWIDVRFQSHVRLSSEGIRAIWETETFHDLTKAMVDTDLESSPDLQQKIMAARMYGEIQQIVGDRQDLEPPVGIQRLDADLIESGVVILIQEPGE